jgi:flagellar FliL protein
MAATMIAEAPTGATDTNGAEGAGKKSKKKLLMLVVLVVVLTAGGWFMFLRPSSGAAPAPEPGPVVRLDSISLNLADGHYLKLGIALQATAKVKEELDGAKALDIAISQLSGRPIAQLASSESREAAKKKLATSIEKAYEHEVMGIYFTEFVMQ